MGDADTVRRVPLEIFNEGDVGLINEIFTPDFVEHVTSPGFPEGRAGLRAFVLGMRQAFPDFRYEVLAQVDDGDLHVLYVQASGTMTGDFMAIPATGLSATWLEMHMARMRGGWIVEHWAVLDQLGMLQQLGVLPAV
ncbi:ester cyclase [Longispora sp. K20-0274]|uniref:ester cyclase n=1 Tax=Longispora sp. K20-0274 TaxID=3088255 RepID=UPI0039998A41